MQILIVEDDAILAMVCAMALEGAGHTIVGPVHDAASFQQLSGLGGTDLALVDINLAGADEGLEIARALRKQQIPSLFISGQLGAARENTSFALGLLRKPYDIEDLLDSVSYLQNSFFPGSGPAAQKPVGLEIFDQV